MKDELKELKKLYGKLSEENLALKADLKYSHEMVSGLTGQLSRSLDGNKKLREVIHNVSTIINNN